MSEQIQVLRMLHTIHAVKDVGPVRKLYQDVFGAVAFAERYHAGEDRDMALLYAADHMIEPMAPRQAGSDTTFARYLARYGEGLQSFELRIADAPGAAEIGRRRGLALSTVYPKFFFVRPESTSGVLVQLCGKPLVNDPKDYRGWSSDWILGHPSSLRRLREIVCIVRDMAMAVAFFTEVLDGVRIAEAGSDLLVSKHRVRIRLGDTCIVLLPDMPCAPGAHAPGVESPEAPYPKAGVYALVWDVDDLAAARAHIQGIGLPTVASTLHAKGFAIDPAAMYGARHEFALAS